MLQGIGRCTNADQVTLPELIIAKVMGTELLRRCSTCKNCKECQFRTDSLSLKEKTEYQIILSKLQV
jgi:hypothetical protein